MKNILTMKSRKKKLPRAIRDPLDRTFGGINTENGIPSGYFREYLTPVRELFACFLYVGFNVFVVWLMTLKFPRY